MWLSWNGKPLDWVIQFGALFDLNFGTTAEFSKYPIELQINYREYPAQLIRRERYAKFDESNSESNRNEHQMRFAYDCKLALQIRFNDKASIWLNIVQSNQTRSLVNEYLDIDGIFEKFDQNLMYQRGQDVNKISFWD